MKEQTCCFTGHRDLTPEQTVIGTLRIMEAVMDAVNDGYTRFITGLAEGADQIFARNVLILKKYKPEIRLVAAISHRGRLKAKDDNFQELIPLCDEVIILSEAFNLGVYEKRNRWMLSESSRVIAAWDGRQQGGTYNTVRQAEKLGIDLRKAELSF